MLAQDNQLRHSLHIVLYVNDCIDPKMKVLHFKRELFVAMECIFVGLVHILKEVLEFLYEFSKEVLLQSMLKLHQESLHTLCLDCPCCQLIVYILPVFPSTDKGLPQVISGSLARNDKFEVIGMAQRDSVQMV